MITHEVVIECATILNVENNTTRQQWPISLTMSQSIEQVTETLENRQQRRT